MQQVVVRITSRKTIYITLIFLDRCLTLVRRTLSRRRVRRQKTCWRCPMAGVLFVYIANHGIPPSVGTRSSPMGIVWGAGAIDLPVASVDGIGIVPLLPPPPRDSSSMPPSPMGRCVAGGRITPFRPTSASRGRPGAPSRARLELLSRGTGPFPQAYALWLRLRPCGVPEAEWWAWRLRLSSWKS